MYFLTSNLQCRKETNTKGNRARKVQIRTGIDFLSHVLVWGHHNVFRAGEYSKVDGGASRTRRGSNEAYVINDSAEFHTSRIFIGAAAIFIALCRYEANVTEACLNVPLAGYKAFCL